MAVWSSVQISDLSEDFRLDAEYYQPEYLEQERAMARLRTKALATVANISDGNHLSIAEEFADEGVRYLRGQDLADFFISDADPVYIPERTYQSLARSHMLPGDVLVGIVGTIGSIGFVTSRHGKLTGNCKLAIVRPHSLPNEYIAAYLASHVGSNEIQRRIRGAVQMGLILPDLKRLPIVLPSDKECEAVVADVKTAKRMREQSRALVHDAEQLLTEALGLSHLDLSESLCYEQDISDLHTASRFGAEYFMPCKGRVLSALRSQEGYPLSFYYNSIRDVFVPENARRGEIVRNFDLGDALDPVLDDRREPVLASDVGSIKKKFNAGDLVISRLRSYLQQIALIRTSSEVPCVGSSEFIVLRPKDGFKSRLSPQTLLVFLRSLPVQTILRWSQDGSQHPRFDEKDLLAIPIPISVEKISARVEAFVNDALDARSKSILALESAKHRIERLVTQQMS